MIAFIEIQIALWKKERREKFEVGIFPREYISPSLNTNKVCKELQEEYEFSHKPQSNRTWLPVLHVAQN